MAEGFLDFFLGEFADQPRGLLAIAVVKPELGQGFQFIFLRCRRLQTIDHYLQIDGLSLGTVAEAAGEIAKSVDYDYVIVNDDLDEAVEDFLTVLRAEKMTVKRSHALIDTILSKGDN